MVPSGLEEVLPGVFKKEGRSLCGKKRVEHLKKMMVLEFLERWNLGISYDGVARRNCWSRISVGTLTPYKACVANEKRLQLVRVWDKNRSLATCWKRVILWHQWKAGWKPCSELQYSKAVMYHHGTFWVSQKNLSVSFQTSPEHWEAMLCHALATWWLHMIAKTWSRTEITYAWEPPNEQCKLRKSQCLQDFVHQQ